MDKSFFDQPNQHYVGRLLDATDQRTVIATEDICDARGLKLLAAGRPITLSIRERLLASKLKKPLETSLDVADGIRGADLAKDAARIFEEHRPLVALAGDGVGEVLKQFEAVSLAPLLRLQLSTASSDSKGTYRHAVITAITTAAIALRLKLTPDAVSVALVAGLAHDMGEMYVSPELLQAKRELSFDEWKAIAVHPRIAGVVLAEFGRLPSAVVRAVQEHHERLDGSGYPSGTGQEHLSELGQILMVSEAMSAILTSPENPEARAMLALRLAQRQFHPRIISLLTDIYRNHQVAPPQGFDVDRLATTAQLISDRIQLCDTELRKVLQQPSLPALWADLAQRTQGLHRVVTTSLHGAGVLQVLDRSSYELRQDPTIAIELHVTVQELKWRMRALSRHVALTASRWNRAKDVFEPVVQSLYLGDPPKDVPSEPTGQTETAPAPVQT